MFQRQIVSIMTVAATLYLSTPAIAGVTNISIGGVSMAVPSPLGFSPVTQQMAPLYESLKQSVEPNSEELIAFIAESDIPSALKGEIPYQRKSFKMVTTKRLMTESVSSSWFASLKSRFKSKNEAIAKENEQRIRELIEKQNKALTRQFGVDISATLSEELLLPVHDETDHTISYSTFLKFQFKNMAPLIRVVTTTVVYVKGKVLMLYCNGEYADLEWSRESSKQWANALVAANSNFSP